MDCEECKNIKAKLSENIEETIAELGEIGYLSASIASLKPKPHECKNDVKLLEATEFTGDETNQKIKTVNRLHQKILPFRGYILAVLSACLFCLSNVLLRMLHTLTPSDNAFINYTVWGIAVFLIAKIKKVNIFGSREQRMLLHLRGCIGVVCLLSIYTGLKFIDPSDVISITHASLIITAVLARIFLKEKLTIAHFIASILTIIGILFICKPKFLFKNSAIMQNLSVSNESYNISKIYNQELNFTRTNNIIEIEEFNTIFGVSFCLIGAFALGIVQIVIKKLCIKKCHYSVLTLYAVYYGAPISLAISIIFILIGKSHQNTKAELNVLLLHIFFSICVGLFGVGGQIFLNLSFKYEDATKLAIIRTTDVFFSFILQYLILNIQVDVLNLFGAMSIFMGVIVIFVIKILQNQFESHDKLQSDKKANGGDLKKQDKNCIRRCIFFNI